MSMVRYSWRNVIRALSLSLSDHDRNNTQNWRQGAMSPLLLWDSGLAFVHGALARSYCLVVLCGPFEWHHSLSTGPIDCKQLCTYLGGL